MPKLENVIPFAAEGHRIKFLQTRSFTKDAKRVFSQDEFSGFMNYISAQPDAGAIIMGSGGLRKVRWAAKGQGKRGGARLIYYFRDLNIPLILLAVYAKNQKATLTKSELAAIESTVEQIVESLVLEARKLASGSIRGA